MTRIPLCVIGAGSIGQRHIEVAGLSDHIDMLAVVEPQADLRAALADRGLPMVAALEDVPGSVRAAIVATPTQDHFASTSACLSRGWAVIAEKPLGATLHESRGLRDAAEAAGLPLFTGHHRRCHPFSIAARDALCQIGEIVGVQGFWSLRKHDAYYDVPWRRAPGAGPLLTNLTHEVDLLRFLLGEITEATALVSSARRGLEIEDTSAMAFRFGSGALGSFLVSDAGASPWSFEAASFENPAIAGSGEDYLRITGTEGALAFPSLTRWGGLRRGGNRVVDAAVTTVRAAIRPHRPAAGADRPLCGGGRGRQRRRAVHRRGWHRRDGNHAGRGAVGQDGSPRHAAPGARRLQGRLTVHREENHETTGKTCLHHRRRPGHRPRHCRRLCP